MSLIRQIWLLLLGSLLLTFVGSITVSIHAARESLQTQLTFKNNDTASALALMLSQQQGDWDRMKLLMTAQFDTGFYQEIRLTDAQDQVVFLRQAQQPPLHAPAWFVRLAGIASQPGVAQVNHGWQRLGATQVISHNAYVVDDLWVGAQKAALALAAVTSCALALALVVVNRIRRPLDQVVQQAQALLNGEFLAVPAPRIPELGRLTQAMNTMVSRLRLTFAAQAAQVESLRLQAHCDALTGLSNRKHFLNQLNAFLQREDGSLEGGLILLRVIDLVQINHEIGHESADRLINTISQALKTYVERVRGCHLGRLNGADFALYLPARGLALETGTAIIQALRALLPAFGPRITVAVGAVEVRRGQSVSDAMGAADAALARAESRGPFSVELDDAALAASPALRGQEAWRQSIASALIAGRTRLMGFPVINAQREIIHLECPLRLRLDPEGPYEAASLWLPLAIRSRLTPLVDERAVSLALSAIAQDNMGRCVNVCSASLSDPHFSPRLRSLLERFPRESARLMIEVPEPAAIENFERLMELARQLRACGTGLGLEHAGEKLGQIERLFETGFRYIKLDASVVRGVASAPERRDFVRGVVVMMHGLSSQVFAEGVSDEADVDMLWQLGLDGMTGPWASGERPDWVLGDDLA